MLQNLLPPSPKTQGARANEGGQILEETIRPALEKKGFVFVKYKDWQLSVENNPNGDYVVKRVPYTSIYQHTGYTEYLVSSPRRGLSVRIECKWQGVPGSVDEKLPYLYLNCIEAFPEKDIILLIEGKGFKLGAPQWLRNVVTQKKYADTGISKNIKVMDLPEFLTWVQRNL